MRWGIHYFNISSESKTVNIAKTGITDLQNWVWPREPLNQYD
ncbi:MAG: hypothetical protein ACTS4Z_00045 [Candidatus Hodgkinia cicadicola]